MGSHSGYKRPPDPIIAELQTYAVILRAYSPMSRADREVSSTLTAYENKQVSDPVASVFASALYLHGLAMTSANITLEEVAFDLLAISKGRPAPDKVGHYAKGEPRKGLAFAREGVSGEDQQSSGPAMPKRPA